MKKFIWSLIVLLSLSINLFAAVKKVPINPPSTMHTFFSIGSILVCSVVALYFAFIPDMRKKKKDPNSEGMGLNMAIADFFALLGLGIMLFY